MSVTLEYSTLHIEGVTIAYLDYGSKSSPPLVLVHDGAFGSDARSCWQNLIPLLAGDFRLIAPDLPGYGRSSKVYDFDRDPRTQRVDCLVTLCRSLGIERAPFVGSSFGGSVVLVGAATGRLPLTVGVSIAGTAGPYMRHDVFKRLHDYVPGREAAEELSRLLMRDPSPAEVERRLRDSSNPGHRKVLSAPRLRLPGEDPAPKRASAPPIEEMLAGISAPFLFIAGEDDTLLEPEWARQMAKLLPKASAVYVADAKHLVHVDQPARVAEEILAFIKAHNQTTVS